MTIEIPDFHPQLGQPDEIYPYRDTDGETIAAVYRFESGRGKEIRPYDLKTHKWGCPEVRPLYGLDILKENSLRTVIVVEGEKCADALLKENFLSTTSMGGANGAHLTNWSFIKERKVILWPDNDEAGLQYMQVVATELLKVGADVSMLDIHNITLRNVAEEALRICIPNIGPNITYTYKDLPKGWDVADAIAAGFSNKDIEALIGQATPYRGKLSSRFPIGNITAENDNWPEPDFKFLKKEDTPPAFPLGIFPPKLSEWIIRTAACKSAPVDYVAASLLTVSASLIGSTRNISPWEGWTETPVLWSAIVGNPSAGKSPAMDPVLKVLRELEKGYSENHAEALRKYETDKLEAELARASWQGTAKEADAKGYAPPLMPKGAKEPTPPQVKRLIIRDATTEAIALALKGQPKGVLTYRDELAGWFASFDRYSGARGGDRAFWLEAFGARTYTVDRIKNGGDPIVIQHLASSILGGIQPDRLESCLMKGDDDGLSARFLYFFPDQVKRQRPNHSPDNGLIETMLMKLAVLEFDHIEGKNMPRTVGLSTEAANIFELWWAGLPEREPNGRMAGWWGKLQGNALRIALVLHYLEWACRFDEHEPFQVEAGCIEKAIQLGEEYLLPMAERAHGLAGKSVTHQTVIRLAKYIREQGLSTFTVRDIQRTSPLRPIKSKEIQLAVNELVRFDWLRATPVRKGSGSGKQQALFAVNPSIENV